MRKSLIALVLSLLIATFAAQQPHIFVFVIDDFGWSNFGPHRVDSDPQNEVQTPNMDALTAEGILLERSYLYWYCSPSRSALQTGRNPIHVNMNNDDMMLYNPKDPVGGYQGIARNFTGIGNKLGDVGYETFYMGKWHVGCATWEHTPAGRGWQHHMIVSVQKTFPKSSLHIVTSLRVNPPYLTLPSLPSILPNTHAHAQKVL